MKRVGQFAVVLAAVASFFAWGTEGFAAEPIRIGYLNLFATNLPIYSSAT